MSIFQEQVNQYTHFETLLYIHTQTTTYIYRTSKQKCLQFSMINLTHTSPGLGGHSTAYPRTGDVWNRGRNGKSQGQEGGQSELLSAEDAFSCFRGSCSASKGRMLSFPVRPKISYSLLGPGQFFQLQFLLFKWATAAGAAPLQVRAGCRWAPARGFPLLLSQWQHSRQPLNSLRRCVPQVPWVRCG